MYVKDNMTKNVYTIGPSQSISEALDLMSATKLHRLPVVDKNGILLGLVTQKLIASNTPNNASSLSVFELNYLLNKLTVADVMIKEPIVTTQDVLLEEAATMMNDNHVNCLPVVVDDNKLIGIITHNDIFSAFIDILGYNTNGRRYVINVTNDRPGIMAEIAEVFKQNNVNINNLAVYYSERGIEIVVISQEQTDISDALKVSGYNVTSVIDLSNK